MFSLLSICFERELRRKWVSRITLLLIRKSKSSIYILVVKKSLILCVILVFGQNTRVAFHVACFLCRCAQESKRQPTRNMNFLRRYWWGQLGRCYCRDRFLSDIDYNAERDSLCACFVSLVALSVVKKDDAYTTRQRKRTCPRRLTRLRKLVYNPVQWDAKKE